MTNKEKFTVLDFINYEFPEFETLEECKNYIDDNFTGDMGEGIHPDIDDMIICENKFKVFVDESKGFDNCEIKLIPISEIPDNESALIKRNEELEAMMEEMINWYAKREDSPMRMNPDKVICEGNNQDEIILKAIEILNKTK